MNLLKWIPIIQKYVKFFSHKSFVRKGLALRELHRFGESLECFEEAAKLEPTNQQIKVEIQKIQKILNEKIPSYTVNELEELPVLDHRSIAGDYYQMTYITYSQFEVMLKDILKCSFKQRIELIRDIFKLIHQNAEDYKVYVVTTIEKKVVDEIYPLFEPFQRKIDKQELTNTLLKFCVENPSHEEENDQIHNSKYLKEKINDMNSKLLPLVEKFDIIEKHKEDFKSAIGSIFMDSCWLILRMYTASPKGQFFSYVGEEFDSKKCEVMEGCKSGRVEFTVYPGYKTSDKVYLNPIVFTE